MTGDLGTGGVASGKRFAALMGAIVVVGLLALGAAWWFLDRMADEMGERRRKLEALDRKIEAFLPPDRSPLPGSTRDPSSAEFVVRLRRGRAATATEVEAAGEALGELTPLTLETLERAARLRLARGPDEPDLRGVVESSPRVPASEVVRVVDALVAAGMKDVTFVGTPEPGSVLDRTGTGGK